MRDQFLLFSVVQTVYKDFGGIMKRHGKHHLCMGVGDVVPFFDGVGGLGMSLQKSTDCIQDVG